MIRRIAILIGLGVGTLALVGLALVWSLPTAIVALSAVGVLGLAGHETARLLRLSHLARRARVLTDQVRAVYTERTFTSWTEWTVAPAVREAVESRRAGNLHEELVIGRIDQDGRALGLFGELPGIEIVGEAGFEDRHRNLLDLVLIGDHVVVCKDLLDGRPRFINEWHNLVTLYGRASVPAVYRADERHNRLYIEFIRGRTIRSILASAGAKILDVQTDNDPELAGLNLEQRTEAIYARGRTLIPRCFSEDFLSEVEAELGRIHSCGVAGLDIKTGNVMVDSADGSPRFVDLERPRAHRSTSSPLFLVRRQQDRVAFNRVYGRNLVTENPAREALTALKTKRTARGMRPVLPSR